MKYSFRTFVVFLSVFVLAGALVAVYLIRTASADEQPPLDPDELSGPNVPIIHISKSPANPNIDFDGHMKLAAEAAKHREARRLTEEDFIKMSQEEGAIILDARSKEKFDILHIKGAVNLSFPDIDVESLEKHLPNKDAKILIYCNNNFIVGARPASVHVTKEDLQDKASRAFPIKSFTMSLNISTYTVLYGYGYKNVYELGPLLDPTKTKIELVSTQK
jgi:rhodanese-related sulfurtransferase